jgi:hypothetical protein
MPGGDVGYRETADNRESVGFERREELCGVLPVLPLPLVEIVGKRYERPILLRPWVI